MAEHRQLKNITEHRQLEKHGREQTNKDLRLYSKCSELLSCKSYTLGKYKKKLEKNVKCLSVSVCMFNVNHCRVIHSSYYAALNTDYRVQALRDDIIKRKLHWIKT